MAERRRVLVVDDHRDTANVLCRSLEEHGYTAVPAYSGIDAIKAAESEAFDCVLLDIMMPGWSGLKVCYELKHRHATHHLPIVILSAKRAPQDISYAKQMGADEYLTKPVKLSKMLESIEKHSARGPQDEAAIPRHSILFVGADEQLAEATQRALDSGRATDKEWLRLVRIPGCEEAKKTIVDTSPRALVIDARSRAAEAPALCREVKLNAGTKHIVVVVLLGSAADDVKFAWADECLADPLMPETLAGALKDHLLPA